MIISFLNLFFLLASFCNGQIASNEAPSAVNNLTATLKTGVVHHSNNGETISVESGSDRSHNVNKSRRIMGGKDVKSDNRPYMVYLQLTKKSAKAHKYRGWLCGGVVVHRFYVLTSAACVEDADRFYVVSGTRSYVDSQDFTENSCAANNRRRVVWKCVPKNYQFDIEDSVKWSTNDIAVVKVEKEFRFGSIERGCDYAVQPLLYNNISRVPEKPKTKGHIIGWGSKGAFREGVYRKSDQPKDLNSKTLQEASVEIIPKSDCAKRWSSKFRTIIQEHMLCTKQTGAGMSEICNTKYANCTELSSDEDEKDSNDDEHAVGEPTYRDDDGEFRSRIDAGRHLRHPERAVSRRVAGGFCENDHGGPLIVKHDGKDLVVGVISACKINPKTHGCQGPFLYTSVFNNRQFISCSIFKNEQPKCRRVFRAGVDHEEYDVKWNDRGKSSGDDSDDE